MPDEPPPDETVDWNAALQAVDGRRDLLIELVEIYFTEQELLLEEIARAVAAEQAHELRVAAHRLKGCLRYFGAATSANIAWELEELGKNETVDGAAELLVQLQAALAKLTPELQRYVDEQKGTP